MNNRSEWLYKTVGGYEFTRLSATLEGELLFRIINLPKIIDANPLQRWVSSDVARPAKATRQIRADPSTANSKDGGRLRACLKKGGAGNLPTGMAVRTLTVTLQRHFGRDASLTWP